MNASLPAAELLKQLTSLRDPQERLSRLVAWGRGIPTLTDSERLSAVKVPGCVAQLWFLPAMQGEGCLFLADSDSAVVKSVAGLLCAVHSGLTPAKVLAMSSDPLADAGIQHHLSPNRRLGLGRLREMMREFARSQPSA